MAFAWHVEAQRAPGHPVVPGTTYSSVPPATPLFSQYGQGGEPSHPSATRVPVGVGVTEGVGELEGVLLCVRSVRHSMVTRPLPPGPPVAVPPAPEVAA